MRIKLMCCSHKGRNYYHRVCLLKWFEVRQNCPVCKDERLLQTHLVEIIDSNYFAAAFEEPNHIHIHQSDEENA